MKMFRKVLVLALVAVSMLAFAAPALAQSTRYVKVSQGPGYTVNLRKTASTSGTILDRPTYGSAIYVHSTDGSWSQVTYYNPRTRVEHNGYIQSQYLVTPIPTDTYWIVRYGTRDYSRTSTYYPGVVELQKDLNRVDNAGLTPDGYYGPATVAAVRTFQGSNNLTVDGVAGNRTKEYLYKLAN